MLLNDVVVGFEGVDVHTEGQAGAGIHGEAHEVGLQVDPSPVLRSSPPA